METTTQYQAGHSTPEAELLTPRVMPALCDFVAGSQSAQWPEEVRDLAKRHILDSLASTVACRDLDPSVRAREFALAQSGGARKNTATILGTRERAALSDAVFAGAIA